MTVVVPVSPLAEAQRAMEIRSMVLCDEAPDSRCTPHGELLYVAIEAPAAPELVGTFWHAEPDMVGGVTIMGRCAA